MSHIVVLSTALKPDFGVQGRHPLAGLNGGVPILWNLFFEASDVARQARTESREPKDVVIAASRKASALERLERRTAWYGALLGFAELVDYTTLLVASVRLAAGECLTMDLSHLAARQGPGELFDDYRRLLEDLDEGFSRGRQDPALRSRVLALSGYDAARPFPPARLLLDAEHPPWEEAQAHARIIGASWTGSLAWERPPARYGSARG